MSALIDALLADVAKAKPKSNARAVAIDRLRTARNDELRHELCMRAARKALEDLERLKRTTGALRDTLRLGGRP